MEMALFLMLAAAISPSLTLSSFPPGMCSIQNQACQAHEDNVIDTVGGVGLGECKALCTAYCFLILNILSQTLRKLARRLYFSVDGPVVVTQSCFAMNCFPHMLQTIIFQKFVVFSSFLADQPTEIGLFIIA